MKTPFSVGGKGDHSEYTSGLEVSELSNHGSARGGRSIFGWTV